MTKPNHRVPWQPWILLVFEEPMSMPPTQVLCTWGSRIPRDPVSFGYAESFHPKPLDVFETKRDP